MKSIQNIGVGFLVSFIGSIPLGYLNLIGFEIYIKTNIEQLMYYLLGVVLIEAIVIYCTLQMMHRLHLNPKWKSRVSVFSILFLFFMAYYFYSADVKIAEKEEVTATLFQFPPFLTGVFLSCINFAQIPFWMSWNLLLTSGNYISVERTPKWFYIIGTLIGTFSGMLILISGIKSISSFGFIHNQTISKSIPLLFICLAFFQIYQLIATIRKVKSR
ncbi:MAG TPA: hypothetical protein VJL37_05240 [Flavobacterium sp.]|nr:hypothetical protein [Flavobacterium sp.]